MKKVLGSRTFSGVSFRSPGKVTFVRNDEIVVLVCHWQGGAQTRWLHQRELEFSYTPDSYSTNRQTVVCGIHFIGYLEFEFRRLTVGSRRFSLLPEIGVIFDINGNGIFKCKNRTQKAKDVVLYRLEMVNLFNLKYGGRLYGWVKYYCTPHDMYHFVQTEHIFQPAGDYKFPLFSVQLEVQYLVHKQKLGSSFMRSIFPQRSHTLVSENVVSSTPTTTARSNPRQRSFKGGPRKNNRMRPSLRTDAFLISRHQSHWVWQN